MRAIPLFAAILVVAFAAAGARADGIFTSPGATFGGKGVRSRDGSQRYVTLPGDRSTYLLVVRVRGGSIVRWTTVRGMLGLPLVGFDGTTDGLSGDGKTLVLAEATPNPGPVTQFAVLSTKSLREQARLKLRGTWSYDAVSPDATTLFLVQYWGTGPGAAYQVRAYDLHRRRLLARPIVDRRIGERLMRGQPATRVSSAGGRWAYTLYLRQKKAPFIHALDTVGRQAFCIDLPLEPRFARRSNLRLGLVSRGRELVVQAGGEPAAFVDTGSFQVRLG